jgi:hypothetical protein
MHAFASQTPARARIESERRGRFISDIVIDYGPVDVLGRLFLKVDTELSEKGVALEFCSLEDLKRVNEANRDSWRPLLPMFDHELTPVPPENAFCMLARDRRGEAIGAQGGLLYTLTSGTLKDEFESMRFFYKDPARQCLPGEMARISAPIASEMVGRVAFVGAVWYRPDWRGKGLVGPMGRANRAYAFTRWYADYSISIMTEELVKAGFAANAVWPHVEWDIHLTNVTTLRNRTFRLALIWTDVEEQLAHFRDYVGAPASPSARDAQVDRLVEHRR